MNTSTNLRTFFTICTLLVALLVVSVNAFAQGASCPPTDETRLQLMDARIQEYLTLETKFTELVNNISADHATELAGILTRIKSKMDTTREVSIFKPITDNSDWTRLREIVCPYLQVELSSPEAEPVIVYKGVAYKNGSEIVVDYDNRNYIYEFEMKNYPDNDLYKGWQLYAMDNTDLSNPGIVGFPDGAVGTKCKMDLSKHYEYKVVAQYGATTQTVSVKFVRKTKDFPITHLWAVDANGRDRADRLRRAKEGEILYFVRTNMQSIRTIDYEIETPARSNDFLIDDPAWSTNVFNEESENRDYAKKISIDIDKRRARHLVDTYPVRTTVTAFDDQQKMVEIQMVSEERSKLKATLPGKYDELLNKLVGGFNKIGDKIGTLAGFKIETKIKQDATVDGFNREDDKSRHYFRIRQYAFGIEASLGANDRIPIPAFSYKIPYVGEVGAYIKPQVALKVEAGATERNRSESENWTFSTFNLAGKVQGSIEAGIAAELLPNVDGVDFSAQGYAKATVYGAVTYRRDESDTVTPNSVVFSAGIDPLILGVKASVKMETVLLDMNLIDITREWYLFDRVEIQSDPIRF